MRTGEFLQRAGLGSKMLETWVDAGWLAPEHDAGAHEFSDVDLARAQLIRDLRHDLGVNDEGIAVALGLIDQMYGLRRVLAVLLSREQRSEH